jgi:diguanylate cyclase (GGDEF)-like protein
MISESPAGDVIGINYAASGSDCALQPLAEQLLALIGEAAREADPDHNVLEVAQRLVELGGTLMTARTRKNADELTRPIVELCARLLDSVLRPSSAKEIAAALSLVRDAVASIDGVERTLQLSLNESVDKFDALRRLNDLSQIKAGLAKNVETLRTVASRREEQWRTQMQSVEQKVQTLEKQLVETRLAAQHDALTGLANRRAVESAFKGFIESRRRFVLALFDIDDFKRINDTYGHVAGDTTLKSIAAIVKSAVRDEDIVGRYGGDEFIVLLADATLVQAEQRLRLIIQDIRNAPPIVPGRSKITVSCGAAACSAGDTFETLVGRADHPLYDVKRTGKNRIGMVNKAGRP